MKEVAKAFLTISATVIGLVTIYDGMHHGPYDGGFEALFGALLLSAGLTAAWMRLKHRF